MALSTQPYKGARDFYPEDKRLQKYIFAKMRQVAERFGYEEYDAPILEPIELYLAKTSEEIVNEQTYLFEDRGGRKVVIRPEMTPTVSRMVAARRQELAYPLRLYSIPNLWRYERPQGGRLREHWQLNVDIFGVQGIDAEQEIVMIADGIFKAVGGKPSMYLIKLNSRELVNYLMVDYLGLDPVQATAMIRLTDNMHKMERADFVVQSDALCQPSQRERGVVEKLLGVLDARRFEDLPEELRRQPSVSRLRELIERLQANGVSSAVFDITLMRGFDYYTDVVFEVFDSESPNRNSLMGGGRYDGLVGLFGVEPVPTVGFGLGDLRVSSFMEAHGLTPKLPPETDIYVVLAGDVMQPAQKVVGELRDGGLNVAVDFSGRKLDKQLTTAVKKGIRYALIIGDQELADQQFTLRDLTKGSEEKHSLARIVSLLKDFRNGAEDDSTVL